MAEKETDVPEKTESNDGGSWWQSWGKSFVDSVKEKTSTTYEMVQKDLSEFYQTIQTDTAHVVVDAASKVQDQIKTTKNEDEENEDSTHQSAFRQGFANMLSSVSESLKTLAQEESSLPESQHADISMSSPVYDRRRVKVQQIQNEIGTYCNEPEGPKDAFLDWEKTFDFDSRRGEMSDLLVKVPEIRAVYSKLVPSVVSHGTFWKRYFYKLHKFETVEERRAALVARAETASIHEDEYKWDSDDGDDIVESEPASKSAVVAVQVQVHVENKTTEEALEKDEEGVKDEESIENIGPKLNVDESNDDRSFEVLSTEGSKMTETDDPNAPPKPNDYQREISDGSLTWSNDGEDIADGIEAGISPPNSNRLSPSKEDSSSGSSIEFIQKVSDSSLVVAGKLPSAAAQRASNDARLGSCSDRLLDVKDETRLDHSETASTSSWISVDDEIRVRKSKKEKFITEKESDSELPKSPASNRNSGSSTSSAVLVEKIECKSMDDDENDDGDLDLDEDINEEELQKIMEKIKSKSGDLDDDDDDWEDWE